MPDINTVSPHPSRRSSSHQMPPPPAPAQASESPSLNILPSNQNTVNNASASNISLPSPTMAPASAAPPPAAPESTSALASGPIRHPRPMTASDLHMELEKEQEAVVNRLTRELQLLRAAHNASVVSNASSTSASNAPDAPPDTHLLSGAAFSTPSVPSNSSRRHHRTASNASTRSQTAVAGSATASVAIPRPPSNAAAGGRQDSVASRHSLSSSPAHSLQHLEPGSGMTYFQQQRVPHQQHTGSTSVAATPGSESQLSPGLMSVTSRYEETALHRQELEAAKKENEALKQRIRELEKMVREKGRQRSGSAGSSAATSVAAAAGSSAGVGLTPVGGTGVALPRRERPGGERERSLTSMSVASSVAVGVPEEELQVGESAASSGLKP